MRPGKMWNSAKNFAFKEGRYMKKVFGILLLVLMVFGAGCKGSPSGPTTPTPQPPAKPLPKILTFKSDYTNIEYMDIIHLTWTTENATKCTIVPFIGNVDVNGTKEWQMKATTTTFTLTAENDNGAVTKDLVITVKSAAYFVLVGYTKDMTSYKCPVINGTVRNDGNGVGYNCSIDWTAYNANNTIIDTASGFPAGLNDIPVGVSAVFNAIFFDLSSWSQISKLTWTMSWLNKNTGQIEKQTQELRIR
jgi:hypothetical protein